MTILTYHRVGDQEDFISHGMGGPGVSVRDFDRQMEFLSRHCDVLSLRDALQAVHQRPVRRPLVTVTFDDGWRDNYTVAWPILQKHKVPATIFLVAGIVGTGRLIWQHRLYYVQNKMGEAPVLECLRQEGLSAPARRDFSTVLRWFKSLGDLDWRDKLIERIWARSGLEPGVEKAIAGVLYLSWEEVRAMNAGGIEFGSHTISHPCLSSLTEDVLHEEIAGSKKILEQALQREVVTFSYPYGDPEALNDTVGQVVRRAGYKAACTTQWGTNDFSKSVDPYFLKRKGMNYTHTLHMWLEISGIKDRLRQWRGKFGKSM